MEGRRIVLATWGSLGDLHPLIAVGLELQRRGHAVVIAANAYYADKVAPLGLEFRPIRPDIGDDESRIIPYLIDLRRGPERLLKELIFPSIREMYEDLSAASAGADLLVASELIEAAPLLAEKSGIRWATVALAPLSLFSMYDPPVVPNFPWLAHFYRLGPWLVRWMMVFGRVLTDRWAKPVNGFRKELGLPPAKHPVFEGKFSPQLVLAMFPSAVAKRQRDWPPNTIQTGFAFFDQPGAGMSREVEEFLAAGDPPVIFTLGSSAVRDPGGFFHESIEASVKLGIRALVIAGEEPPVEKVPSTVHVTSYVPYSKVFDRAAAIVHPGGIGTTAQVLRAGRPMIIVPFAFDQPDNAARMNRLGVSETIPRAQYRSPRVTVTLRRILSDALYGERAANVAADIRGRDGAAAAATALESLLERA